MAHSNLFDISTNMNLDLIPGLTNIVDRNSNYVAASNNNLALIGYKNHDQLVATSYYNMPCDSAAYADLFIEEDKMALQGELKILSHFKYKNEWKILLGHKTPIKVDNEVLGLLVNFIDISHTPYVDISYFLFDEQYKLNKKPFSSIIQNKSLANTLTKRETEIIFYYIRGFEYKDISSALFISVSTVRAHIENIKFKLDVNKRSQLVEKAVHLGIHNLIPDSLFNKV